MTSHVYKRVDGLDIQADVYAAAAPGVRPVVVWIHGGALINGHRQGVSQAMRQPLLDAGFAIVSIDYRLAPETMLPGIIEDLEDAFAWVRECGPELFGADPDRIVAMGGSAGGYLALTAGFRVMPRPVCLVSFWGYGDLIGDWYSRPSPHPCHHGSHLSWQEARKQVEGPPIADARERQGDGGAFYQHCRQHGIWPTQVSGWNPVAEADRFRPFMPLCNVSPDYPPTLLIHGTEDTDVPYEQAVMMARKLTRHSIDHELITVPGGEHGLAGADPDHVAGAYRAALAFVIKHVPGPAGAR